MLNIKVMNLKFVLATVGDLTYKRLVALNANACQILRFRVWRYR